MDDFCNTINCKIDNVLAKIEQLHNRLLSIENIVKQVNDSKNEVLPNEVCILMDKPKNIEESNNTKKVSKYKTTMKTNFFDNKNETKWTIHNKVIKKTLKIQSMKISRIELKEKLLSYMNYELCFTDSHVQELDIMDLNIPVNEKMQINHFESFVNLIMNKHCMKK